MWSEQIPSFRSFDGPLTFRSTSGREGCCYLSVYERRGSLPVVMYIICNHRLSDAMYVRRRPLFSRGAGLCAGYHHDRALGGRSHT